MNGNGRGAGAPRPARVFLVQGDGSGWAIDEDRRLTMAALAGLVEFVDSPEHAEVVHACWWERLMELPAGVVEGRRVVCHFEDDPVLRLREPSFRAAMERVDHWIAQSRGALRTLGELGVPCSLVPYALDVHAFAAPPEPPGPAALGAIASLPRDAYVVANFHRDTLGESLGSPGAIPRPKLKKGPDVFAEVLALARRRGVPVVALLAGPRRHWVRARLRELGVPYVFAGREVEGEDYPANILRAIDLAHLYRAARLHLSCSRHEGGPRGVLEAAAAGVPQLSTPSGVAPDVLAPDCIFTDACDAADRIEQDWRSGLVARFAPAAAAITRNEFTPEANRPRWANAYAVILGDRGPRPAARRAPSVRERPRRLALWNEFHPPPWGGGNQFMLALGEEAARQGIEVVHNAGGGPAGAHLLNSCWFDVPAFERAMRDEPGARVVHRIDGPINLYRRTPDSLDLDRACMDLNARYAHATVVQSAFTLRALAAGGFAPVRPVIIHNTVDRGVFRGPARPAPRAGEPLRVIAASWSDNPGKGAAVYEWLDRSLDDPRARAALELTFVGRIRATLRNWRVVDALPSAELAALYRDHHVYLTASRDDPCSNALVEAMCCGLPALYLDSGGHPELVEFGGARFRTPMEIPPLLDSLRRNLDAYRAMLSPPTMQDVAARYLRLLFGNSAYGGDTCTHRS